MEQSWLKVDSYSAIRISEYKNKLSIQEARRTEKDNYIKWTNPLRYNSEAGESQPATKADGSPLLVPLQIPLGTEKQAAINILKGLLFQLTGEQAGDSQGEQGPPLPEGMPEEPGMPF